MILIFSGLFYYNKYVLIDIKTLNMSFEIADKIGFNVGSDALYFGKTMPGGSSKRNVNLENNFDFPVLVSIKTYGSITGMVTVSDNDFILRPGEKKGIIYYVNGGSSPEGNYTGTTRVVFKRVFFQTESYK